MRKLRKGVVTSLLVLMVLALASASIYAVWVEEVIDYKKILQSKAYGSSTWVDISTSTYYKTIFFPNGYIFDGTTVTYSSTWTDGQEYPTTYRYKTVKYNYYTY